ncbi:phosphonatase-like hydrolase [Rhodococcus artemisiae]|uniref:Phosphonatase-like hydrolase n=1 Tax=Rhodococcus artemisiae TaxID=714159 RepID=A0ABU7LIL2_9NOCA|nr:phosphonatase-like hydrolase [Rhodococcus artemisiae]MEE2060732.1 phosphonatase-like hydrolase [Rhodococcus artemisiae]
MIELAIFDMAGTTIDDRDEVYRVLRESTERHGATYTDEEFQQWMGTEKRWAIENLLRIGGVDVDEALVERAWAWFREELRQTYTDTPPTPLDGVEEALRELKAKGIKVGLTTGFSREIADLILQSVGWQEGEIIDRIVAGDEVPDGRPEPFLIQSVMAHLDVQDAAAVVSAGDTASDVESARRAGVTSIGVLTGHLTRPDFDALGADLVLGSVADLPSHAIIAGQVR